MKSPYKKTIVFDTETGGLKSELNSLTELAFVSVDMETLEEVDELEVMIKPYLDLSNIDEDSLKEAKSLYKNLSIKDEDNGRKVLIYKGQKLGIKDLLPLSEEIESFRKEFNTKNVFKINDILDIEKTKYKDLILLFFDRCYNPGAFEATGINREMLVREGVELEEAFSMVLKFFTKHTIGNNKPILSGHNIKKFDNPFMEKFFGMNGKNFFDHICSTQIIDTLEWARLKFPSMSSYSLGVVSNEVGITLKDAHRAINDTRSNAKLFIKMMQHLRGQGSAKSSYKRRKFKMNF